MLARLKFVEDSSVFLDPDSALGAVVRLRGSPGSKNSQCRYVTSQPPHGPWLFCSGTVEGDSPYCPHHHAKCYDSRTTLERKAKWLEQQKQRRLNP